MKPQSPCKDCKEREVGCHAACKRYASYSKELEEWKQTVKAEKYEGREADDYRFALYEKIGKMLGGKK